MFWLCFLVFFLCFFDQDAVFAFSTCIALNFNAPSAFPVEVSQGCTVCQGELGFLPVPPVPWLCFSAWTVALGTTSAFKFLFSFSYWYLIDIISGTKGVRTSRKKPCAVTSYLLHHLHSFATEVSISEGTLETCEFLWLVLCSVSSTFLFGG